MKKYLNSPEEVIKALNGKNKIFEKGSDSYYQMINGIVCRFYCNTGDITINPSICIEKNKDEYYIKEPEPIKFEVNKPYKAKCGQKVFISFKLENNKSYGIVSSKGFYCVDYNGKSLLGEDKWDIISYWEEEK